VPRAAVLDESAISHAVNEVMQVVELLKQALDQMEDVLELTEHAERQKLGDEREIESLRRALRQLQQPRGGRDDRRDRREPDRRGSGRGPGREPDRAPERGHEPERGPEPEVEREPESREPEI
jgi:plasmid stabilization system protein ParE